MSTMQGDRQRRAKVVGVTGGIACGKSTVANVLMGMGVDVLDADDVAREVVVAGTDAFARIVERFGSDVVQQDGSLDRSRIASVVFSDEDARKDLNEIVHPPVMARVDEWIDEKREGCEPVAIVIPLLFEVGAESRFDEIICVAATKEAVLHRLAARGIEGEDAAARVRAQWPLIEKEARANATIRNDGSLEDLEQRTLQVWNEIVK